MQLDRRPGRPRRVGVLRLDDQGGSARSRLGSGRWWRRGSCRRRRAGSSTALDDPRGAVRPGTRSRGGGCARVMFDPGKRQGDRSRRSITEVEPAPRGSWTRRRAVRACGDLGAKNTADDRFVDGRALDLQGLAPLARGRSRIMESFPSDPHPLDRSPVDGSTAGPGGLASRSRKIGCPPRRLALARARRGGRGPLVIRTRYGKRRCRPR